MLHRPITFLVLVFLFAFVAQASAFAPYDTIRLKEKKIQQLKSKIFDAPIVIKTSPTAFLWGGIFPYTAEYRVLVEVTTGRTQTEQIGISVLGKSLLYKMIEQANNISSIGKAKVSGWKIQYAHKFYLIGRRKHAPTGFFFGPLIQYTNARVADGLARYYSQTYYDFHNFNANVMIGVQGAYKRRVTFEVYGGLGYKQNTLYYHATTFRYGPINTSDFWEGYSTHLNGVFGINLGYAF